MRLRGVVQAQHRLLREGLALWIAAQDDLELVGTAVDGPELVEVCAEHAPDFVVLSVDAPDWDGLETARQLRRMNSRVRLIATAEVVDAETQVAALDAGVSAVMSRTAGVGEVLAEIRGTDRSVHVRGVEVRPPDPAATVEILLTERELEILVLIGAGLPAREIAERLDISAKTVDNHKQRIYAKLGVQNQAHAVAVAMRAGLLGLTGL